jgi:endonuclease III
VTHATYFFKIAGIAATPLPRLQELIFPVGFYRNKAKFVAAAAQVCDKGVQL